MRTALYIGSGVGSLILLLIVSITVPLTQKKTLKLDMAVDSIDDQFIGCKNEMNNRIKYEILPEELKTNKIFKESWDKFAGLDDFKRIIKVYSDTRNVLYSKLNDAVSSGRKNYVKTFVYKSFHFLLTRAIQFYQVKTCVNVFRRASVSFETNVQGREIRFGRFTSTSFKHDMAGTFGKASCFKIRTCLGAKIAAYSVFPFEEEVLVPPYEKFQITNVAENQNDCRFLYTLISTGEYSNMNCELLK